MVLLQYLLGVILSLLPVSWLARGFGRKNRPAPRFYFSGRVAIYRLAQTLRHEVSVVILPDYICNVLYRVFIDAGFEVISYTTTELLEPSLQDIKYLVHKANRPTVLCLAPIMGAEGGQNWITSPQGREWRNQNKVVLLFDCCQDITRLFNPEFDREKNFAIVSSFNDKSFAGVMGAVVVTDIQDKGFRNATAMESLRIGHLLIFRILSPCLKIVRTIILSLICKPKKPDFNSLSVVASEKFDYSYCLDFPHTLSHSGATKLQIGIGVAGLLFRRWYIGRKINYMERVLVEPIRTPFFMTASYVMTDNQDPIKLKSKLPYAIHGRPTESLRPLIKSFHFKGFFDRP
jgi:hypothetical protein